MIACHACGLEHRGACGVSRPETARAADCEHMVQAATMHGELTFRRNHATHAFVAQIQTGGRVFRGNGRTATDALALALERMNDHHTTNGDKPL